MRVAGIGCRKGAQAATLKALLQQAGGADLLATIPLREPEVAALAALTALPLRLIPETALAGIATPTRSPRLLARHGTGSVAEAVALVAAGQGAAITLTRITAPDGTATLAIATGAPE
jgi:cobalt-precorrin 5A hydrolase